MSVTKGERTTLCPQKTAPYFIFLITLSKLTDFNDFGVLNPEKI